MYVNNSMSNYKTWRDMSRALAKQISQQLSQSPTFLETQFSHDEYLAVPVYRCQVSAKAPSADKFVVLQVQLVGGLMHPATYETYDRVKVFLTLTPLEREYYSDSLYRKVIHEVDEPDESRAADIADIIIKKVYSYFL